MRWTSFVRSEAPPGTTPIFEYTWLAMRDDAGGSHAALDGIAYARRSRRIRSMRSW